MLTFVEPDNVIVTEVFERKMCALCMLQVNFALFLLVIIQNLKILVQRHKRIEHIGIFGFDKHGTEIVDSVSVAV